MANNDEEKKEFQGFGEMQKLSLVTDNFSEEVIVYGICAYGSSTSCLS